MRVSWGIFNIYIYTILLCDLMTTYSSTKTFLVGRGTESQVYHLVPVILCSGHKLATVGAVRG